jgi:hypothetical protein
MQFFGDGHPIVLPGGREFADVEWRRQRHQMIAVIKLAQALGLPAGAGAPAPHRDRVRQERKTCV